jgi:hypothetical protein
MDISSHRSGPVVVFSANYNKAVQFSSQNVPHQSASNNSIFEDSIAFAPPVKDRKELKEMNRRIADIKHENKRIADYLHS